MEKELGLSFIVENPTQDCQTLEPGDIGTNFNIQDLESKGEEKAIVVVLLGWTGATDKQLRKYSDIYSKRGCIVVRCIIPVKVVIYKHSDLPLLANHVVRLLKAHELQSHPTFFHAFSNGGAYLYSFMLKEIASQKNPAEFDIRGTIFDSAPFWPTIRSGRAAMSSTCRSYTQYTFGLDAVVSFMLAAYVVIRMFWIYLTLAWECVSVGTFKRPGPVVEKRENYPGSDFLTRIWKLKNHAFAFLYSETDEITPWRQVEDIAGAIRDRGNPVDLVKFDGSSHVLHYKKYPKEYTSEVINFINVTMKSNIGPAIYWDEYN